MSRSLETWPDAHRPRATSGHRRSALPGRAALRRRILGEDEPRTLNTQRNLGALLVEKGEEVAAADAARGARRMRGRIDLRSILMPAMPN